MASMFQKARASKITSQVLKDGIPARIELTLDLQKDFDPYGIFEAVQSRFRPVDPGYYHVDMQLSWSVSPGNGSKLSLYKNGVEHTTYACYAQNSTVFLLSDMVFLNGTTDYLEMWGFHMMGRDLAVGGSSLTGTYMTIVGPF